MKIETDDIIFGVGALLLLAIWYLSLILFNSPLISIIFLWTAMIMLSISYIYVYKKRNRNMRVMRIRFFVSGIPIYPMLIYYIYKLVLDNGLPGEQRFLPIFIVLSALILNGIVLYFYEIRKKK